MDIIELLSTGWLQFESNRWWVSQNSIWDHNIIKGSESVAFSVNSGCDAGGESDRWESYIAEAENSKIIDARLSCSGDMNIIPRNHESWLGLNEEENEIRPWYVDEWAW